MSSTISQSPSVSSSKQVGTFTAVQQKNILTEPTSPRLVFSKLLSGMKSDSSRRKTSIISFLLQCEILSNLHFRNRNVKHYAEKIARYMTVTPYNPQTNLATSDSNRTHFVVTGTALAVTRNESGTLSTQIYRALDMFIVPKLIGGMPPTATQFIAPSNPLPDSNTSKSDQPTTLLHTLSLPSEILEEILFKPIATRAKAILDCLSDVLPLLTRSELEATTIESKFIEYSYKTGETVFNAGDAITHFFILRSGSCVLTSTPSDDPSTIHLSAAAATTLLPQVIHGVTFFGHEDIALAERITSCTVSSREAIIYAIDKRVFMENPTTRNLLLANALSHTLTKQRLNPIHLPELRDNNNTSALTSKSISQHSLIKSQKSQCNHNNNKLNPNLSSIRILTSPSTMDNNNNTNTSISQSSLMSSDKRSSVSVFLSELTGRKASVINKSNIPSALKSQQLSMHVQSKVFMTPQYTMMRRQLQRERDEDIDGFESSQSRSRSILDNLSSNRASKKYVLSNDEEQQPYMFKIQGKSPYLLESRSVQVSSQQSPKELYQFASSQQSNNAADFIRRIKLSSDVAQAKRITIPKFFAEKQVSSLPELPEDLEQVIKPKAIRKFQDGYEDVAAVLSSGNGYGKQEYDDSDESCNEEGEEIVVEQANGVNPFDKGNRKPKVNSQVFHAKILGLEGEKKRGVRESLKGSVNGKRQVRFSVFEESESRKMQETSTNPLLLGQLKQQQNVSENSNEFPRSRSSFDHLPQLVQRRPTGLKTPEGGKSPLKGKKKNYDQQMYSNQSPHILAASNLLNSANHRKSAHLH